MTIKQQELKIRSEIRKALFNLRSAGSLSASDSSYYSHYVDDQNIGFGELCKVRDRLLSKSVSTARCA